MSECLKGARVAKRQLKPDGHVKYQCIRSMAELEQNIDGSLSIMKFYPYVNTKRCLRVWRC